MYFDNDTANTCGISETLLQKMSCNCSDPSGMGDCRKKSCEHGFGLSGYPLAMVYSPLQDFTKVYDRDAALAKGTIFEELDLPFKGESVAKGGGCRG